MSPNLLLNRGGCSFPRRLFRAAAAWHRRRQSRRGLILGIETSCDDTAAAVVSAEGDVLGESIATHTSTRFGGVIPSFSMGLHAWEDPCASSPSKGCPRAALN